jgi:hypothetical protein
MMWTGKERKENPAANVKKSQETGNNYGKGHLGFNSKKQQRGIVRQKRHGVRDRTKQRARSLIKRREEMTKGKIQRTEHPPYAQQVKKGR